MRVLIVVPAWNEAAALPALLVELAAARAGDVLVVDDGSTDATAAVAAAAGGGVRVLRLCRNLGIGGAVQAGLKVALREGYDCAVQLDGDGQHPPAEVAKLCAGLDGADLVVGVRHGFRSTWLRRVGSWWLARILGLLGVRVSDPTSGFRVYGRRALTLFDRIYPYDYPEPESLALASRAGLRVVEVGIEMRARQGGASSIGSLAAPYYMFKVTLALLLGWLRSGRAKGEVK